MTMAKAQVKDSILEIQSALDRALLAVEALPDTDAAAQEPPDYPPGDSLGQKQRRFVRMVADLILFAYRSGYELSFAEAYRPPDVAELYARQGRGIRNSLHCERLAVDFNLFRDGQYLDSTEAHRPLGEYWESIGGTWGGRFNDGGHYSLAHGGRK